MTVLFVLLCIGVIAGVALVAAGRLDRLPEAAPDRRPEGLTAAGLPAFDVVPRGYRMDEVDALVEGLLRENARLRAQGPGGASGSPGSRG